MCVCQVLSRLGFFVTPQTVACQAPLSMGFPRQEYWSGLPFPPPGDLPNPGTELASPKLQADSLPLRNNLNCLSADEWIKMWCINTMAYSSAIKKDEIMPFAATWMDLEIIILSEVRQRKTYHLYLKYKRMVQINLFTKQKYLQTQKTNLWLPNGKGVGEGYTRWLGLTYTYYYI